jgi:hypothetical protein
VSIKYSRQADGTYLKTGEFTVVPEEVLIQVGDGVPFKGSYTLSQATKIIEEAITKGQVSKESYSILPVPEKTEKVAKEPKVPKVPKIPKVATPPDLNSDQIAAIKPPRKTKTTLTAGLYTCTRGGVNATLRINPDNSIFVLEGSTFAAKTTLSCPAHAIEVRKELVESGVLVPEGDFLKLTADTKFYSTSGAAGALLGSSVSGPAEWRATANQANPTL